MTHKLLHHPAAPGLLLALTAVVALIVANGPTGEWYASVWATLFRVDLLVVELNKPLILWVNDGLMAVFFLLVGLEIKRELLFGGLSRPGSRVLPLAAAVGGMAVPALFYVLIARSDPAAIRGWAIPAATDIAFALGALALLGQRAPASLKTLLLAIAIVDDLGAIVIIAVFYTAEISFTALALAGVALAALIALNRAGVRRIAPYMVLGALLWLAVLKSGLHATIAGVIVALTIPSGGSTLTPSSPLIRLEHAISPFVNFGILPIFAFANAGVALGGVGFATLFEPVALGIWVGLFFGKQVGVMAGTAFAVRALGSPLPEGARWGHVHGMAVLTGIGFTMSLFIGGLAFDDPSRGDLVKVGVLFGSFASGVVGAFLVARASRAATASAPITG